uniref:Uncharacterized protein n=1 Tax=Arundo donax TaxID=35708 RepID=A0A0A9CJL3_ARUDO
MFICFAFLSFTICVKTTLPKNWWHELHKKNTGGMN